MEVGEIEVAPVDAVLVVLGAPGFGIGFGIGIGNGIEIGRRIRRGVLCARGRVRRLEGGLRSGEGRAVRNADGGDKTAHAPTGRVYNDPVEGEPIDLHIPLLQKRGDAVGHITEAVALESPHAWVPPRREIGSRDQARGVVTGDADAAPGEALALRHEGDRSLPGCQVGCTVARRVLDSAGSRTDQDDRNVEPAPVRDVRLAQPQVGCRGLIAQTGRQVGRRRHMGFPRCGRKDDADVHEVHDLVPVSILEYVARRENVSEVARWDDGIRRVLHGHVSHSGAGGLPAQVLHLDSRLRRHVCGLARDGLRSCRRDHQGGGKPESCQLRSHSP